jgi:hypothetical protein
MKKIEKILLQDPEALYETSNFINNLAKLLNLNVNWNKEQNREIELKKCFMRGVIRESRFVGLLQKHLITKLKKNDYFKNYNFFSKFYPMVHLPGDKSESSEYLHYDEDENIEIFTCWMPLTQNVYEEISIFKFENALIEHLNKILSRVKFFNFFSKRIKSKYGYIYIWSGKRLHKGNLNTSNNISCAIQMKISKKELTKEKFKTTLFKEDFFEYNKIERSEKSYLENYEKLNFFVRILNNFQKKEFISFNDLIAKIKNLSFENINENYQEISFSLSVYSQRMRSLYKNDTKYLFNCLCYDVASIILGGSNIISIFRVEEDIKFFFKKDYEILKLKNMKNLKDFFNLDF